MYPSLLADVLESERSIGTALARRQDRDGFWRDFQLKPGSSEAWSTAWIGWGLSHALPSPETARAIHVASQALTQCMRNDGWGYNRLTGSDADSTAWAVRLMSIISPSAARNALPALARYIDPFGEVHTFSDVRLGRWSDAHADVTAVAGLACIEADANRELIMRIRHAVLQRAQSAWPPTSYWWATQAYGLAWTIVFLSRSGGVPQSLAKATLRWLEQQQKKNLSTFDHALHLLCLVTLDQAQSELAVWHVCRLTASCQSYGWDGATTLLVPQQETDDENTLEPGPHADSGLMTTSLALAVLCRWRRAIVTVSATAADVRSPSLLRMNQQYGE